jgi:hypothetical protein
VYEDEAEAIEKVRQEIMRFHELLGYMREKLEDGERAYVRLFANCTPEDKKNLKEKALQRQVAEAMLGDLSALRRAVEQTCYDAREVWRAFEELYNIITADLPEGDGSA